MKLAGREVNSRRYRGEWGRALLAVSVVAALVCLAIANTVARASSRGVEDGVLWRDGSDGLVAAAVATDSPAALAGLVAGDVLLAVGNDPVERYTDLRRLLRSVPEGTSVDYTLLRLSETRLHTVSLRRAPIVALSTYLVLAGVGLLGLLVGAAVRVQRPGYQATLHFFWLTVAFFGALAFSYTGWHGRLDWVFFWADEVATLLLAPLFMHFALVFPERTPGWLRHRLGWSVLPLVYAPAVVLGAMQAAAVLRPEDGIGFVRAVERVWRLEHLYLAACMLGGFATMVFALRRVRSITSRRQLRWIVSGAALGGLPFALCYLIPWALGFEPPSGLALPVGLIPLAFGCAIVRYRLRDVEVIVKRSVGYAAVVAAMVVIYLGLERLATAVFLGGSNQHNSVIALLATAVVVLLAAPVKKAVQTMVDRVYYRERFDYRRALTRFARDLSTDLDLDRLSERLVNRVTETLGIDRMVLLLGRDPTGADADPDLCGFQPIRSVGFEGPPSPLPRNSSIGERMLDRQTVLLDDPIGGRMYASGDVALWRSRGLYYFVPCISEGGTIAVMALGRKESGEPLSSEDMALLAAVAGQVATALENGRLYGRLQQKAGELDRMRQFSENIVESLSDGLAVLDLDDRIIRWNAGFERLHGVSRAEVIGRSLDEVFDEDFVARLSAARAEKPAGAALYRVPMLSGHEEPRRLRVKATTAPLLTPSGRTSGTMLIVVDSTARVQLEEQLQLSEKMASIGLLAAGVAHEVNTPLTGISSFTQMLLEDSDPEDPRTRLLEKIERQTFRAARIVNGLLNLARPGRTDTSGPVDINAVIADVLVLLEHQLEAGRIRVRRELAMPALVIQGVEFKMQQVFLNLFLNARDAMPSGGWLTVRSRVERESAVIEVADTGAGIFPEHLSRIYDPFFTTKTVGQGTGLGLSVTYGVVQEHQGTIECTSRQGQGTRFTLTLPLATPDRAPVTEVAH
jgi:hypothetical protein